MKKITKILTLLRSYALTVLLGLAMLLSVANTFAQSGTTGPLFWELGTDGKLTISGHGAMPDYDWGDNGAPWDEYMANIESVEVGIGVTRIGDNAFNEHWIKSVTLPNTITSIGLYAFNNCSYLKSITLPNSITTLGRRAFCGCKFESIVLPNSLTSTGVEAFAANYELTSVTIPNSITKIDKGAFSHCIALESIILPNSITTIGVDAFSYCDKLSSVIIPNSVTTIEDGAFYSCKALESITLPNSVTTLRPYVFSECTALKSIALSNSTELLAVYVFQNCTALKSITIPNGIPSIGYGAFAGCTNLESIDIPNSVTSIAYWAFQNCEKLSSIIIPSNTSISKESFSGCTALTSITALQLVPQYIIPSTFEGVDISAITLKVPTSSVTKYQTAEVWKEMIIVGGGILVNPVPNNPERGYTTGDGLYGGSGKKNESATVTAIPRNGYKFVNWTVDGKEVSKANPYSFTVTEDIKLVANFEQYVGIKHIETEGINIYPNPTAGELRIESGGLRVKNIEIFDMQGRNLLLITSQEKTINISHLPSGVYFVKIQTEKGLCSKKVIKH